MLFNSLDFFIFFVIILVTYFLLSSVKYRVFLLLAGSYYFYMQWNWKSVFLILGLTLVNFYAAIFISNADTLIKKKLGLFFAVLTSLGVLFYFKYFNFFNQIVGEGFGLFGVEYKYHLLNILLPVGISFYTFQTLSYTIDVYKKKYTCEKNLPRFALYVSFFPQLVAGPIERAGHLLNQFKEKKRFDIQRVSDGSKLVLWGLFKKVVIAEQLAIYVNTVYAHPELHSGPTLIMATYFFAFQIYLDFSAYSDMAIGMAKMMGYDLVRNFRLPYLATSITDFWRRWHISLTTWFTDYIYIPLGGSKVAFPRWILNICIVFLISGLWHGAAWTFVIWGILHTLYYLVEILWRLLKEKYPVTNGIPVMISTPFKIFLTFNVVSFGWIFFRATSLSDALIIVQRIFLDFNGALYWGASQVQTYLALFLVVIFYIIQILQHFGYITLYFSPSKFSLPVRWASYFCMIFGVALFGVSDTAFIYFQF